MSPRTDRPTTGWTDRHLPTAAALVAAAASGGLATLADRPYDVLGLVVVAVVAVVALSLDAFAGIVAGFGGAAVVIAARQLGGDWAPSDFGLAVSLTVALVLLGWLCGLVRGGTPRPSEGQEGPPVGVFGSLGLLSEDQALARLDEELVRARRHRRPLTVFLVSTEITADGLPAASVAGVHRTVARLVESLVPETAVPFALSTHEVGALLPETDEASAWDLLGPVVDAASRASFSEREQAERHSLVSCAELHAGLVSLSAEHRDADSLLAALRHAVRGDRAAPPSTEPVRP